MTMDKRLHLALAMLMVCSASCVQLQPERFADYVAPAGSLSEAGRSDASSTAPAHEAATTPGTLMLGVTDAVILSLRHNKAFVVEQFNPAIRRTFEQQELALFDPVLSWQIAHTRSRSPSLAGPLQTRTATTAFVDVSQFFPTGTDVSVRARTALRRPETSSSGESALELSVTQSLLRGLGVDVNLATLRQARLDIEASQYELRGFAEALVAQVEQAYWDYVLAHRQIQIVEASLDIATRQLNETNERIRVGALAKAESAAARSEAALRQEDLINARSNVETSRLRLLRLVNPQVPAFWQTKLVLTDQPATQPGELDSVDDLVRVSMLLRPELNQARLAVKAGDLEIVKTRNGLLPRLDAFASFAKTGFGRTLGGSLGDMTDEGHEVTVGISGDYPIFNRAPRARDYRAHLARDQAAAAVANLEQLVEVDVRTAYELVQRFAAQIEATGATVEAQGETVRVEQGRFGQGVSTLLDLSRARRDLLTSQLAHVQAQVNYIKAIVDLHRVDGSLLTRRGIAAPGDRPVDFASSKQARFAEDR